MHGMDEVIPDTQVLSALDHLFEKSFLHHCTATIYYFDV
jgi:hypothetical protein